MPKAPTPPYDFNKLIQVTDMLLGPEGCPWDKKQTHQSLVKYCIEETHEFAEAVESGDHQHMSEELGDLLFQVALHSSLAKKNKTFDESEVLHKITEKMIRRHPHVFQNDTVDNVDDVMKNWEAIKAQEKPERKNKIFDIPSSLPALIASQKIGEKTKKLNFDWDNTEDVFTKVTEEYTELKEALTAQNKEHIKEELGDLLFSLAQLSRHLDFDAEQVLRQANRKFKNRFEDMVAHTDHSTEKFSQLSPQQKEELWELAKNKTKKS